MSLFTAPRYWSGPPDPQALSRHPEPKEPGPVGILFINLGTPAKPTVKSIRRYLKQFLSDPRVVELPALVWQPILRGAVLPFRPRGLQEKYQQIWLEQGSPLLVHSRAQVCAVGDALTEAGLTAHVELAMRYGEPSIETALRNLHKHGCERILVVPMYPQYAASTTATAVDAVARVVAKQRNQPELRFIKRYHDQHEYIQALAQQVQQHWQEHGQPQRLLLSFHGLPTSVVEQGDPYHRDCMETADSLAQLLGQDDDFVQVAFQSRFGAQKWLEPATLPTLQAMAQEGLTHVDVMCPGFLADCLETLEEIDMQCRDAFLQAGGQRFGFIPCLNGDESWAFGFSQIIQRYLGGWV